MSSTDIVIGGYSCRLPESESPTEFWTNLVNQVDMVTADDRRWPAGQMDTPARFGKLKDLNQFDAAFFGIHGKQAHRLDPQLRLLLMTGHEAIRSAGFDPHALRGSRTGVYIGACYSDALAMLGSDPQSMDGYEPSGCALSMFANRLSYSFDFHGPSQVIDTACSSSLVALDTAVRALRNNEIDYALVGGSNVILRLGGTVGFQRHQMLSPTGACHSFDAAADGFARAEGVVTLWLTRGDRARRRIAVVLGTGTNNDGFTEQGITFPNASAQARLLQNVYTQAALDPAQVRYIETHGTGTRAGDPQETQALCEVLCANRSPAQLPLLMGSVKSNMGHAEGAAGLAGLIKVVMMFEQKMIPANLHYQSPNPDIKGLVDGRLKVVDQPEPWEGGIVGVNSFGFGGSNAHVIVSDEVTRADKTQSTVPITPVAARTHTGCLQRIETIRAGITADQQSLLLALANSPLHTHAYRSCVIERADGTQATITGNNEKRPRVWFVFPGMGAQWMGMGQAMMSFEVFSQSIRCCQRALQDTQIDLVKLLTQGDDLAEDVTATFVALTAIQIGFIDLLRQAGIKPEGMVGHSAGEIACAYADGALTIEQSIQTAYWRGRCVSDEPAVRGCMLVATLDWENATRYCNKNLTLACYNSSSSVTFSGAERAIHELLATLQLQDIEASLVRTNGIAFHSAAMTRVGPNLQQALSHVITRPVTRSSRWISTAPDLAMGGSIAECSADYFVANLVRPVCFAQALQQIPTGSVVIEIGAHALMGQAITHTVPAVKHIACMLKNRQTPEVWFDALAQLYVAGVDVDWTALYPARYPLTTACAIPHLTDWDLTQRWDVPTNAQYQTNSSNAVTKYKIDLTSAEYNFITDHKVQDKILFPGMGYLWLVWRHVADLQQTRYQQLPVVFHDVKFSQALVLSAEVSTSLTIQYLPGSGYFELRVDQEIIATGRVAVGADAIDKRATPLYASHNSIRTLTTQDVYKEFRLRGYHYGTAFQGIRYASLEGDHAQVAWGGNWVTYLDSILQTSLIGLGRGTRIPTALQRLTIDPTVALSPLCAVYINTRLNRIYAPGVVVEDCKTSELSSPLPQPPPLREFSFIPYTQIITPDPIHDPAFMANMDLIVRYTISNALRALETAKQPLPEHLQRLHSLLAPHRCVEPRPDEVYALASQQDVIYIRLAMHVFSDHDVLLTRPMEHIVSFSEYKSFYSDDRFFAYLINDRFMGTMVDMLFENVTYQRPLRVCEIGAGTGGLTRYILPRLRSRQDTYFVTDITTGFFESLKLQLTAFDAVTQYLRWDINQPAAELIKGVDVIVGSNVLHAAPNLRQALANIHDALNDGGFLLLHEITYWVLPVLAMWGFIDQLWRFSDPEDRSTGAFLDVKKWQELVCDCGFELVALSDHQPVISLVCFRKVPLQTTRQSLRLSGDWALDLPAIQSGLQQAQADNKYRLWIEADAKTGAGLVGLIASLRKEPGGDALRCLYADDLATITPAQREQWYRQDRVFNIVQQEQVGYYGYLPLAATPPIKNNNVQVALGQRGDLSSLHWQSSPGHELGYEIETYYLALNYKDVMIASGRLDPNVFGAHQEAYLGGEFSGITRHGTRVMGFINQSFHSHLTRADNPFVVEVPDDWTLAQAATVPVAYLTAYLALLLRAKLQSGEKVLIHTGAGALGQAAIRIALSVGAEVFTTVGTPEKRRFIRNSFPMIPEDHIGSSRDSSFVDQFLTATAQAGMDVILNSLADNLLRDNFPLLRRYGRFVEVGKYDMMVNNKLGMEMFLRDISVFGVGLNNVARGDNAEAATLIACFNQGLDSGVIQPLGYSVFNPDQLVEAFRTMARGQHMGKLLIRMCDTSERTCPTILAKPRYWCDPSKAYLITGGLGGLGLELAQWLIERGAKHLILTHRAATQTFNGYQSYRLFVWQQQGISVVRSGVNVADIEQTEALIRAIEAERPLAGIFHLAMVLRDALTINQTATDYAAVISVKQQGARNLDTITRRYCAQLSQFVVFSSLVAGQGNGGQGNYGFANAAMEQICRERQRNGYPALAVQWGPIVGAGFVENNRVIRERFSQDGVLIQDQSVASVLASLEQAMLQDAVVVGSFQHQKNLQAVETVPKKRLRERTPQNVIAAIKGILGLAADADIPLDSALSELGMDSLMAVEIEQCLKLEYDIRVSVQRVRHYSLAQLGDLASDTLSAVAAPSKSSVMTEIPPSIAAAAPIELYHAAEARDTHAVYVVAGFMLDPRPMAASLALPTNRWVYLVRYDRVTNMQELVSLWRNHVQNLSTSIRHIQLVGHSVGATVIQRLLTRLAIGDIQQSLYSVLISPPQPALFDHLNKVTAEDIDKMSPDEANHILKQLPFCPTVISLELAAIRAQLRFFIADRFYRQELATVDKVLLPVDDPFCWTKSYGKTCAAQTECCAGNHAIDSLELAVLEQALSGEARRTQSELFNLVDTA
ncbi:MAG: acyltransferase domain-containing protein [Gammaproteobacteria bacterium]|nr:acyltransferase domain-containing protein [Gammaproteobacteria bacterium]